MQMDVGMLLVIGDSGGPQIIPGTKRLVQKSEGIHFTVRGSGRSMRQAAAA